MPSEGSPRFLISRLSHIGDCVATLPLLCALRREYPEAFIAWAVEKSAADLLRNHEALDFLITVEKGWLKSPSGILNIRRQLKELQFDVAIDPQSLTKSSALSWLSGAPNRIGLGGKWGRELAPMLNNRLTDPQHHHIVPRSLELLQQLGIEKTQIEFHLAVRPESINKIQAYVREANLSQGYVTINPGCSIASRFWEMNRYGMVAKHLGERHGLASIVVWAGDKEKTLAEEIVAHSDGHAILAPDTSLQDLAALLKQASFYIGSDTGPTHIAAALGTQCIALFGTTRAELSGPYGDSHILLQEKFERESKRNREKCNNDAMKAITALQVCEACDDMVNQLIKSGKSFCAA